MNSINRRIIKTKSLLESKGNVDNRRMKESSEHKSPTFFNIG